MARSVRLLPMASAGGGFDFSLNDNDWVEIEQTYRNSVPSAARVEILKATASFVYFEIFERNAPPLSESIDRVDKIKEAAWRLYMTLHSGGSLDSIVYADTSIRRHFDDPRLSKGRRQRNDPFDALSGILSSLSVACSRALKDMSDPNAGGHREGECWENWIRHLTKIVRDSDLPSGVSKGSDKSDSVSPFVLLVKDLQERVPDDARRHHHSDAALAKAIVAARRQNGTKKSRTPPKKVPPE